MKFNPVKGIVFGVVLSILVLSGCNMPQQVSPTNDLEGIVASTRTALAVSAFLTSTSLPVELPPTTTMAAVQLTPMPSPSPAPIQLTQVAPPTSMATELSAQPGVLPSCSYVAKFEGETIPDGTSFNGSQEFLKTWSLRNTGSCTWSPDTTLVFVRGEQMDGVSPKPIEKTVAPNSTIQVAVALRAPANTGQYQGYWMLRSPEGVEFGLGANADVAFWVKIQVGPGSGSATVIAPFGGPQDLGAPSRQIDFEGKTSPWYLGSDDNIDYDLKGGKLVITASKLTGDRWRVANFNPLDDFFFQANFRTGANCSGKDGYGVLVRAPEKASGVINSGYVFSFSCDGKYRVYRMDSGNFEGIQNWTAHPALIAGKDQSNMMGIYANGDKLQLFANGIMIFQFNDAAYNNGLLGLMIRAESINSFQVSIEEAALWNIP